MPGPIATWWLAIRPATLTAAAAPVLVGSALALHDGAFQCGPALAALVGALLIQIGTNLANDADDFARGADTAARRGPLRVTQSGLLSHGQVRGAAWVAFGLAAAVGAYLVAHAGWPIALLGVASIASGLAYTGGPWPLGYRGLGDVFVLLFFGVAAVTGTYYVQAGTVTGTAFAASLAVGALATAILVVNNVRDRDTDAVAGKRTLPVRFGAAFGRAEYVGLLALAYLVPASLWLGGDASAWALLPLLTLAPVRGARTLVPDRGAVRANARDLIRAVLTAADGPTFNAALRGTAKLQLVFCALFALGVAV